MALKSPGSASITVVRTTERIASPSSSRMDWTFRALACLAADVGGSPLSRLRTREQGRLSGDEDEAVRDDAVGIGAHGFGMVREVGDVFHLRRGLLRNAKAL